MTEQEPANRKPDDSKPGLAQLTEAVDHVNESIASQRIAVGAAKGILFSVIETLGALIGDPDLPEHARSGYEALRDKAADLKATLEKH